MKDLLKQFKEPIPAWLENYKAGCALDLQDVFKSRLLYYPGSGYDKQPVETCIQSGCVHLFLYVDFGISRKDLEHEIQTNPFQGYHIVGTTELSEADLCPNGWRPSIRITMKGTGVVLIDEPPYSFLTVFERDEGLDDSHGEKRFAVIFLFADGIAAFDALFGNRNIQPPYMVVLQDQGFGGNYDSFGEGGMMEKIAIKTKVRPETAMVGENTRPWKCFQKYEGKDVCPVRGGMKDFQRFFYVLKHD